MKEFRNKQKTGFLTEILKLQNYKKNCNCKINQSSDATKKILKTFYFSDLMNKLARFTKEMFSCPC